MADPQTTLSWLTHSTLSTHPVALCCAFASVLQLRSRAVTAENGASEALAESAALEQQLAATRDQVGAAHRLAVGPSTTHALTRPTKAGLGWTHPHLLGLQDQHLSQQAHSCWYALFLDRQNKAMEAAGVTCVCVCMYLCCCPLQLGACQARVEQLEGMLSDCEARLQQAQEQAEVLAAERDVVARNLLRAEVELNDVSDYSTKMFRQVCLGWGGGVCVLRGRVAHQSQRHSGTPTAEVLHSTSRCLACPTRRLPGLLPLLGLLLLLLQVRFISHVLDKNSAVLGKLPEFASLTRDLRAFVAANSRTWEPRDSSTAPSGAHAAAAGGAAAAPAATVSNAADTTASGMRDVAGKA